MKFPGNHRNHWFQRRWIAVVVLAMLLLSAGIALASGGGEHEGHASKGWAATDTYKVMNFAVLAIALFLVLRKPASQGLNGRIEAIKTQLKELEGKKSEAEKQLAEYKKQLDRLDKEAEKMVAEYIRQGEEAKTRILKEAEATAEKLKEQAKKNIEHEFKQARVRLQQDIVDKALAKAEEKIRKEISAQDQERLIDEYLDKVVA